MRSVVRWVSITSVLAMLIGLGSTPASPAATTGTPPFNYSVPSLVLRLPNTSTNVALVWDVSRDGRYVLYATFTPPHSSGTPTFKHVFVYDRYKRRTTLAYAVPTTSPSQLIQAGRFLDNSRVLLDIGVPNRSASIAGVYRLAAYVKNVSTGRLTNISTDASGTVANGGTQVTAFDNDQTTAFASASNSVIVWSLATNLVAHPAFNTSGGYVQPGMFEKNLQTGDVRQVDLLPNGRAASQCEAAQLSSDGNEVLMNCSGGGVTSNVRAGQSACYLHNLTTNAWQLISTDSSAHPLSNATCSRMSPDWSRVVLTVGSGCCSSETALKTLGGRLSLLPNGPTVVGATLTRGLFAYQDIDPGERWDVRTMGGAFRQIVTRSASGQPSWFTTSLAASNGARGGCGGASQPLFASSDREIFFQVQCSTFGGGNMPGGAPNTFNLYLEHSSS